LKATEQKNKWETNSLVCKGSPTAAIKLKCIVEQEQALISCGMNNNKAYILFLAIKGIFTDFKT